MGPGMPGIGFQKSVSAASVVGDVMVVEAFEGTDDIDCEYW
jgi:hypothetical protein